MARKPRGGGRGAEGVVTSKIELDFTIDEAKLAEIKRCLDKGKLTITLSNVDLVQGGRLSEAYLYD